MPLILFLYRIFWKTVITNHTINNENLAIKSILDAIVPLVCVDDATRYCDNFYLSQHDMNEFSELYIVRKGCTKAWAAAHKELDFARAIIWYETTAEAKSIS